MVENSSQLKIARYEKKFDLNPYVIIAVYKRAIVLRKNKMLLRKWHMKE